MFSFLLPILASFQSPAQFLSIFTAIFPPTGIDPLAAGGELTEGPEVEAGSPRGGARRGQGR